jgi:hypothetical protein
MREGEWWPSWLYKSCLILVKKLIFIFYWCCSVLVLSRRRDLEVLFLSCSLRAPASAWTAFSLDFFISSAPVLSSLWFVSLRAWAVRFLRFAAHVRRRIPFVVSQIRFGSSPVLFCCCRFFVFPCRPWGVLRTTEIFCCRVLPTAEPLLHFSICALAVQSRAVWSGSLDSLRAGRLSGWLRSPIFVFTASASALC